MAATKASFLEILFEQQLKDAKITDFVKEAAFIPGRRYRADFYFEDAKTVVEIDGGTFMAGPTGHTSITGYHNDRVRDQLALAHGILTIRFTSAQVNNGEAIRFLREYLAHSGKPFATKLGEGYGDPPGKPVRRKKPSKKKRRRKKT